jgi:hypothetical protein
VEPIDYLDIRTRRESMRFVLESAVIAIGRSATNDIPLANDPSVSRGHAMIERLPAGWTIRDIGSRNGTFVNGRRIWSGHLLHPGDEIRIGTNRMTFRRSPTEPRDETAGPELPPELTRRERDVLVELCRPALSGDVFTAPTSIREIARQLFVTDAAVKQHITNLYDKFGIHDEGEQRRVRLANEAIRRGVVTLADLDPDDGSEDTITVVSEPLAPTTQDG